MTPIFEKHGYASALWCAMYSLGMVPIVDASQPNNPNFDLWYQQLLCPVCARTPKHVMSTAISHAVFDQCASPLPPHTIAP